MDFDGFFLVVAVFFFLVLPGCLGVFFIDAFFGIFAGVLLVAMESFLLVAETVVGDILSFLLKYCLYD